MERDGGDDGSPSLFDARSGWVLVGLLGTFVLLCVWAWPHALDDTMITARYGANLASGDGATWNPGEDPVEGFTSFAWMLVSAGVVVLGTPALTGLKVASVLAGCGLITVLWAWGVRHGKPRWLAGAFVAAIAWNPSFAVVSAQGMETSLAALLALFAALAAVRLVHPEDGAVARPAWQLAFASLASLWTRPDLIVFLVPVWVGVIYSVWRNARVAAKKQLATAASLGLILPGAAYMAWRVTYYGHLFPNAFYIKSAGLLYLEQIDNVASFLLLLAGPVALAAWTRSRTTEPTLRAAALLGGSAALFLAFTLTVAPIQSAHWRYQMPMLGVLVFLLLLVAPERSPQQAPATNGPRGRRIAAVAVLALVLLVPAQTGIAAKQTVEQSPIHDMREVGEALAPFQHLGHGLFTTESGAPAFYSGWRTMDHLGLNNETIAHDQFRFRHLVDFDPGVVVMFTNTPGLVAGSGPLKMLPRLEAEGFDLVAIDPRTGSSSIHLLYFVRPGIEQEPQIACALAALDDAPEDRDRLAGLIGYGRLSPHHGSGCDGVAP